MAKQPGLVFLVSTLLKAFDFELAMKHIVASPFLEQVCSLSFALATIFSLSLAIVDQLF